MSNSKQQENEGRVGAISRAYRDRINHVEAGAQRDAEELAEADTLSHDVHELDDEQKFVGGVDVKKDAETEEDFVPTPEAASFEETRGEQAKADTKKTADKK